MRRDPMERARLRNAEREAANAASRAKAAVHTRKAGHESPPTPRRKSGLDWLCGKGRLTDSQLAVGRNIGLVLTEAARAELPSGSDPAAVHVAITNSPTLAAWRIDAIARRRQLLEKLHEALPGRHGIMIVHTLDRVCRHGETCRDIARGVRVEAAIVEERLKLGLAVAAACHPELQQKIV